MKLKHPRPYKTAEDLRRAEIKARLNIEKKLDQQYGRKPLTYEEIIEKAYTIKSFQKTPSGPVPTATFLVLGADRFKDDPEELYNYYLLEIKPLLT